MAEVGLPVIDEEKELVRLIKEDNNLKSDRDKRMLYITLAGFFEDDFAANLDLTSIDLDEKYGTGSISSWQKFLNYPCVKKYIKGFLDERAEKAAAKQLSNTDIKTTDAIRVAKMMEEKKSGDDNSRLVVVFLPQKDYLEEI